MTTKYGRVVIYNEDLPLIKSHDPTIICSFEFTWQIKYLFNSLAWDPSSTNLARWWHNARNYFSKRYMDLITLSYEFFYPIYPLPKDLGTQTKQGGELPSLKLSWPFHSVINMKSREKLKTLFLQLPKLMTTTFSRALTIRERFRM